MLKFRSRPSKPHPGHRSGPGASLALRWQAYWQGTSPCAFLRRAVLVGLLAALVVFSFSRLNKNLLISFDLLTDHTGPFQVYHADADGVFNERDNFTRYTEGNAWSRQSLELKTIREFAVLRLDPVTQPGRLSLGRLDISSRWGQVHFQGPTLQTAMHNVHDLRIEAVAPDVLRLKATGADPYFHLNIPAELLEPSPLVQLPRALFAGLLFGMLWWLLDQGSHRLKRHNPAIQARCVHAWRRGWMLPVVTCLALTFVAQKRVDNYPVLGDGVQNLLMAVNVFKHDTLSLDNHDHPRPTNFREPLPSLLMGLHLKLFAPEAVNQPFIAFRSGDYTRTAKLINLAWMFAGLLGVWLTVLRARHNNLIGLIATALVFQFFFHGAESINTLYTELATATLIIWCSYALLRAVQQQSLRWFLVSGSLLGLLTLTKAAFLYIGAASIGLMLFVLWRDTHKQRSDFKRVLQCAALMATGFALVLAPWVARNELQFDDARVNSRGELILWGRALLNNMSNEEVMGLLYDQAPTIYKRLVAGTSLAASEGDYERGGRWQRLNRYQSTFWESDRAAAYMGTPDQAVSFHFKAGAEAKRRLDELVRQGHPDPDLALGMQLKREALQMIAARPLRHLFMTAPFFWHGFWSLKPSELPWVSVATQDALIELLNLAAGAALIGVLVRGLWTVNVPRVALTVLPVGMMFFYAFFTHNIHRYTTPTHPMMLLVLVLVISGLYRRFMPQSMPPPEQAAMADPAAGVQLHRLGRTARAARPDNQGENPAA